jgi:hypothetical protein
MAPDSNAGVKMNGNGNGRLKFDGTISLGTVIHLVVLLLALGSAWTAMNSRMSALEAKVSIMYDILIDGRGKR